jgi:hypothetical protein
MVDALIRARRWLAPSGVVIDLRPADVVPDIEIALPDGSPLVVGHARVGEDRRTRHRAADRALGAVLQHRVFDVTDEEQFSFFYYPDSLDALREHLATKWRDTHIDDATHGRVVAAVAAHPEGRLCLRERVAIRTLRPR